MDQKNEIKHSGIVEEIGVRSIKVGILVDTGCEGCQIKEACSMSDQIEKEIEIDCVPFQYKIGQRVTVSLKTSQGANSKFLIYVLPFLLLLITMTISSGITSDETLVGIISVASLIAYFTVLYLFRRKIGKKFSYEVNPIN